MKPGFYACAAAAVTVAAALPAAAAPTFRIDSLTANNAFAREVNSVTGDDRGGMAVSGQRVFLTGDAATGVFTHDLSGSTFTSSRDGIFMNVRDGSVWTLATSATTPYSNSLSGTSQITHVIQLDGTTGAVTSNVIALSTPVTISNGFGSSGMYSGYDRLLQRSSTGAVTKIDLTNGQVTSLGSVAIANFTSENWASWGVAEIFGGQEYLTYRTSGQDIVRTRISDGATSTVATFSSISDLANFAVSPTDGRWYFHYEGGGQFGSRDETLGYADATFTILADQTSAVPEPATWAMMLIGFGGIGASMRRRKTSARIKFA